MEKLVVTRHTGGSFESRSPQTYPLQHGYALQREKVNRHSVGIPLERRGKWPAAPTQGSNRRNEEISYESDGQQRGRPATLSPQRTKAITEPQISHVWGTDQSLPESRTPALVEIRPQGKPIVHQELDRACVARSCCRQHENHANSRLAGQSRAPGRNQAEDQKHPVRDLLARGPMGIRGTQPRVRSGRHAWPPRRLNWRAAEQQNLHHSRDSAARCRASNSRAVAAARSNDGAHRCRHGVEGLRVGRVEVEECRLGHKHPSIRICFRGRRIEGYQEQKQRSAPSSTGYECASSLARAHTLSLGRRLDLCQSALPWQDPVYVSNLVPTSHSPCNRASLNLQEQQASADWVAHATPITRNIADLERRECEGRTIATSSHDPQDNLGTLRTSGFRRPAESAQEGRPHGAAGEISREIKSAKRRPNCVETVLGVRGCPKSLLPKSSKYFKNLVSAAGLEPATHALKGHCSTN